MVLKLVLIHVWLLVCIWMCVTTIWGQMAQRTYEARMRSRFRWFLMAWGLSDRQVWVRQQKILAWVGLVVALGVYAGVMLQTLR